MIFRRAKPWSRVRRDARVCVRACPGWPLRNRTILRNAASMLIVSTRPRAEPPYDLPWLEENAVGLGQSDMGAEDLTRLLNGAIEWRI